MEKSTRTHPTSSAAVEAIAKKDIIEAEEIHTADGDKLSH